MNHIILQPSGSKESMHHMENTIYNSVYLDTYKSLYSPENYQNLIKLYPNHEAYIWGVTQGRKNTNERKWESLSVGDTILFSGKGRIFTIATLTYKMHSREFARAIWGTNEEGFTWEYMYFVDEIKHIDIPYKLFNSIVGYSPNFIIQGFNVLDDEKSTKIYDYLQIDSECHFPQISEKDYLEAIEKLMDIDELDKQSKAPRRVEQGLLRKHLFKNSKTAICAICGKEYPIDLMVASHIKKRALCSKAERLDYKNIVVPMCRFGCDELFEKGYISVKNGHVVELDKQVSTNETKTYISNITGLQTTCWTENTKAYFEWHYNHHNTLKTKP